MNAVLTSGPLGPAVAIAVLVTLTGRVLLEATGRHGERLHHHLGVVAIPLLVVFVVVVVARFATAW